MTTLPNAQHAVRRKAYAPHYTPNNLILFQSDLHDYSLKLVDVRVVFPVCRPTLHLICYDVDRRFSTTFLANLRWIALTSSVISMSISLGALFSAHAPALWITGP